MMQHPNRFFLRGLCLAGGLSLLAACQTVRRSQPSPPPVPAEAPPVSAPAPATPAPDSAGLVQGGLDSAAAEAVRPDVIELPKAGALELTKKGDYRVVLMLPFLTDRFDPAAGRLPEFSSWSLSFYAGVQLGLDELSDRRLGISLSVVDTKGSPQVVETLLRSSPALDSADLIIGPYRRENIQLVADFVKNRAAVQVSPYSAASGLTRQNPHYIQVRPSLETHCGALMRHALSNFSPQQIVLLSLDQDLARSSRQYMQNAYFTWAGARNRAPLAEYEVKSSGAGGYTTMDPAAMLQGRDTVAFLVSAWTPAEERFVYSFLRKLDVARRPGQHIVVYGTPVWRDYERVDPDYLEKYQVHISSYFYTDPADPDVRDFRRAYFNRFGALPGEEAFLGYDIMVYFGGMLERYGTGFPSRLEGADARQLHTSFAFERIVSATSAERPAAIEQYENKYVHILRFQDYQYRPAD